MRGDPLEFLSSMVLINAGVELRLRRVVIMKRHYECVACYMILMFLKKVDIKNYANLK